MKQQLYTSLYLSKRLSSKLDLCVEKLGVDKKKLLSVLCYKAGTFVCTEVQFLKTVDYQERGDDYEITPVCFFDSDHEYMHAQRLACKVSVSKLLACAMLLYLDEIMEKGINQMELLRLEVVKNSYKKKSYKIKNCIVDISKNDQFEEYIMQMRMKKKET